MNGPYWTKVPTYRKMNNFHYTVISCESLQVVDIESEKRPFSPVVPYSSTFIGYIQHTTNKVRTRTYLINPRKLVIIITTDINQHDWDVRKVRGKRYIRLHIANIGQMYCVVGAKSTAHKDLSLSPSINILVTAFLYNLRHHTFIRDSDRHLW